MNIKSFGFNAPHCFRGKVSYALNRQQTIDFLYYYE